MPRCSPTFHANFEATLAGYRDLLEFSKVVPVLVYVGLDHKRLDRPVWQCRRAGASQAAQIAASRWAQDPANKTALIRLLVDKTKTTPAISERIYDFYIVQNPGIMEK